MNNTTPEISEAIEYVEKELGITPFMRKKDDGVYVLRTHLESTLPEKYWEQEKSELFTTRKGIKSLKFKGDDPMDVAKEFVEVVKIRKSCKHEQFEPLKDKFGNVFPDGRGMCAECSEVGHNIFPEIKKEYPKNRFVSTSMSDDLGYVSTLEWPSDCFLQAGDGVVIAAYKGGKNYRTGFFEAFPDIDGFGTFIRGEGESIQLAEKDCWSKYQKMFKCRDHKWVRTKDDKGNDTTSGASICSKCDMRADALPPTTLCKVCNEPTNMVLNGSYFCPEHYYGQNIDDVIAAKKEKGKFSLFNSGNKEYSEEELVDEYIIFSTRQLLYSFEPETYTKDAESITGAYGRLEPVKELIKDRLKLNNIPDLDTLLAGDNKLLIEELFSELLAMLIDNREKKRLEQKDS